MKTLKIETTYHDSRFNMSAQCYTVSGWEANAVNPEDFGCSQLYSGRHEDRTQALQDILSQVPGNVKWVEV